MRAVLLPVAHPEPAIPRLIERANATFSSRKRPRRASDAEPLPLPPTPPVTTSRSLLNRTSSAGLLGIHRPEQSYTPTPIAEWDDVNEVWQAFVDREKMYYPQPAYLEQHPQLKPKMRAKVLDWLIEVCEEFAMHRETFYLAVNFFDRYLSVTADVPKTRLQIVGVTALFIAAKIQVSKGP